MTTEEQAAQATEAVAPGRADLDVGAIVGLLRRKRGMSLDELATRSDLSPSFISAVERGKSDIALGRLSRIAAVFGLDVASLLTYSSNTARPRFLTSDDRMPVDRGEGVDYRRLRLPGVDFELITVSFEPRTAFRDALAHDGIDIVYVPVGSVVLVFDGVDYVMNAGDSGVWSGRTPHAFRNDTDSPAQLVAVVTDTVWDLT